MDHAWAYASDQRQREENEDSFGVFDFGDFTLLLVCDGMGGHAGGRQASSLAVHTIWKEMSKAAGKPLGPALAAAITQANKKIHDASRKHRRLMGMGTTVTAVAVRDKQAHVAHVGDSRVYLTSNGEIVQLTRDHSMVNLFVDAELLSPEEAASHPEAHVLSRSLGVERTVEVDVQEPLEVQSGDTFILCSDGVSGVVEDPELAAQDWSDPKEAVRQVLWMVRERDGDDNATIAAVSIGVTRTKGAPACSDPVPYDLEITSGTAPPPVSSPAPGISTPKPSVGQTLVPGEAGGIPAPAAPNPTTPPPLSVPQSNLKTGPGANTGPGAPPPSPLSPAPDAKSPGAKGQPPADKKAPSKLAEKPGDRARRMRLLLLAVGGGSIGLAALLAGGLVLRNATSSSSGADDPNAPVTKAEVTFTTPDGATPAEVAGTEPTDAADTEAGGADTEGGDTEGADTEGTDTEAPTDDTNADGSASAATTAADIANAEARFLWEPEIPVAPQRDPHRPTKYVANPPGGPEQFQAITAARGRECAESHQAVEKAVNKSIDFARLYTQSWDCFDMVHQKPLLSARATSWQEFQKYVPHFQGYGGDTSLPYWYRPATEGVEYRLAEYLSSEDTDLFAEVIADYRGYEKLADSFAIDLLLEAEVAAVFATHDYEEMAPRQFWARRVYQVSRAMSSPVGQLLEEQRPEVHERINKLMETATYGGWNDPTMATSLPEPVGEALAVGRGERPAPRQQKIQKEEPPPPPPPPKKKETSGDDGSMPIIHRRK